ncbi:MAG: cytochrome c [Pseudomonadales bacterium]|jgi:mono/diheme cytochrome c family protein|nr:cytochrome c [Pseudomonadales bacterium]
MNKISKTILSLTLTSAAATLAAQEPSAVNGDASAGAQTYYVYGCYGCHGYSGYGRKDLNNTGSAILASEDVFRAFMRGRADVAPLLPVTDMPNYPANSLSDAQVSDLYAYIRSMPKDVPETGDIETFQKILQAAERPYQP